MFLELNSIKDQTNGTKSTTGKPTSRLVNSLMRLPMGREISVVTMISCKFKSLQRGLKKWLLKQGHQIYSLSYKTRDQLKGLGNKSQNNRNVPILKIIKI